MKTAPIRPQVCRVWAGLLAAGLFPAHARAAEPARPSDPSAATSKDPVARFKALSAQAEAAYQQREYQAAIDAYLEAYGALPSADVLYNIAYIYDHHLQKPDLAQDFYRRVIRMPDSTKEIMALSMTRLSELEARDSARATLLDGSGTPPGPDPAPTPTPGAEPVRLNDSSASQVLARPPDDGPGAGPWVLVALGGLAVAGGAVMGVVANGTHDDFLATTDPASLEATEDRGRQQALAADILGIGGGALVATGLIWFLAASGDAGPSTARLELPAVRPLVGHGALGLTFGGHL